MGEMSPWHWAIVIGVALLLFGAKRLPDAARSLGRSARILRAEMRSDDVSPVESGDGTATPAPSPSQTAATTRDTTAPPSTS